LLALAKPATTTAILLGPPIPIRQYNNRNSLSRNKYNGGGPETKIFTSSRPSQVDLLRPGLGRNDR
jgi:hypothetical protein